jgi:hypothetical protein
MSARSALAALILTSVPVVANPCSVSGIPSPPELVQQTSLIVRARASDYVVAPSPSDLALLGTIRFEVLEVVKGTLSAREVQLRGYLSDRDDFNDRPVPYDFVRPEGRHGDCFASSYRKGAEHLLFLRFWDGRYSTNVAALAPVNEQLRGRNDAWLRWVRSEVERSGAKCP